MKICECGAENIGKAIFCKNSGKNAFKDEGAVWYFVFPLSGRQIYERQQYWTQKLLVLFAPRMKALAEYATEIYGVM